MQLAIHYSPTAATLLQDGIIETDLYKTTEWPDMIATAQLQRPAYAHFPLLAGRHDVEKLGWDTLETTLATTVTPYVNTHLAPRAADFQMSMLDEDLAKTERLVQAMMQDIAQLVERYGAAKVVLENANYDPNYDIPISCIRPALITQIVEASGCGLLLDLAHATMAATYLGMPVQSYIEQLPLHALKELHITGTQYVEAEARLVDHFPMTERDWATTEWAFECIRSEEWPEPWAAALEYGGVGGIFAERCDPAVIARDVPRLYALVQSM
jgi:uncharacterized protein (UPF0276 family)